MNAPKKPDQSGIVGISGEALIGIGITIAALGLLCLLLGTAEHFRSVPTVAVVWFAFGAGMVVLGSIIAVAGRARRRR
jgi:hypothetical protein